MTIDVFLAAMGLPLQSLKASCSALSVHIFFCAMVSSAAVKDIPALLSRLTGGILGRNFRKSTNMNTSRVWRMDPMSENIVNVTDASFEEEVLKAERAVLVDYWADWCGPCKMIAPVLEEIAKDYEGKLKVCKLNIDENNETPPKFGIRGIPTLMLFKGGNVEATKVGALSKSQLAAFIDANL
jgi:thioredoxin 1